MGEVAKKIAAEVAVGSEAVLKPNPFFTYPIPIKGGFNLHKLFGLKKFGIGCYPEGYNPRVHGAYHQMVFYGKPDKRFCDLTIMELPGWLRRRSLFNPLALWSGVSRTIARYRHYWWYPLKASPAPFIHMVLCWYFTCYFLSFEILHATHRKSFYHW